MWYQKDLSALGVTGRCAVVRVTYLELSSIAAQEIRIHSPCNVVLVVGDRVRATVVIPQNAPWHSAPLPVFRRQQRPAFRRLLQDALVVCPPQPCMAAPANLYVERETQAWPWYESAMRLILAATKTPEATKAAVSVLRRHVAPSFEALLWALYPAASWIVVSAEFAQIGAPTTALSPCPWACTVKRAMESNVLLERMYTRTGFMRVPLPLPPKLHTALLYAAVQRATFTIAAMADKVLPPASSLKRALDERMRDEQDAARRCQGNGGRLHAWAANLGVTIAMPTHAHGKKLSEDEARSLFSKRLNEFTCLLTGQSKRAASVDRIASCDDGGRDANGGQCACPLNRNTGEMWQRCQARSGDTPVSVAIRAQKVPPCWRAFVGDSNSRRWDMARMLAKVEYCERTMGIERINGDL